ncbi:MAG: Isoquinoline 1-oxidoreductase subunit [Deltaproteobacteria bacterium]|nr:MAG: Isoquinoline 1-oxidoreductase subunit [Deltaproteobacteria bacterium]
MITKEALMVNLSRYGLAISLLAAGAVSPEAAQVAALKPVAAFSTIRDERARSVALLTEAARVIQSPRCLNCHPVNRQPTQGDDLHAHVPLMYAGPGDHGVAGLQCKSCHGDANFATLASSIASIPGHSHWGLAPASMAWQRKSLREICLQLKDGTRNGGRSLSQIREHMAKDSLVGWAWHPGEGRSPAPGTQAQFGALIRAWIVTGAHCPES